MWPFGKKTSDETNAKRAPSLTKVAAHITGWTILFGYVNWAKRKVVETPNLMGKILLALMTGLVIPFAIVFVLVLTPMVVYHAYWPDRPTDPRYTDPENINLTAQEKGSLLVDAAVRQMEIELEWWTPNAYWTQANQLDNYAECKLGVLFATKRLADVLTYTVTRMGPSQPADKDMVDATDHGFNQGGKDWGAVGVVKAADSFFRDGVRSVRRYQERLKKGEAVANVLSNDIYIIFKAMTDGTKDKNGVLDELYSRLTGEYERITPWNADNHLYFSACAAVPVRDVLNVIRTAYHDKLDPDSLTNLDAAIALLEEVSKVDPIFTWDRDGEFGLMPAVTRALSVPVGLAFDRVNDVAMSTPHN